MKLRIPPNPSREVLDTAYAQGLLRKNDLEPNTYYHGHSRSTDLAKWCAELNAFVYLQQEFGQVFIEEIRHVEDEPQFDVFLATVAVPTDQVPNDRRIDDERLTAYVKQRKQGASAPSEDSPA